MYGRRLRLNRLSRPLPSNTLAASRRRTRPAEAFRISQQVARILDDYVSGELPRVPRSAFCVVSSSATLQRYHDIVERIVRWRRYATQWRAEKYSKWRDEATSHMDAARTLTTDSQENLLEETKELLGKATISLKKISHVEKHYDMVFVYDIGEITMLSKNYIAEFTTMFPEIDSQSLFKLTEKVLNSVHLTQEEMSKKEVISTFYPTDDDMEYWRRVGPKYVALELLYGEISTGYRKGDPDISQELCNKIGMMGEEIQNLRKTVTHLQKRTHQRWRRVRKCLELVHQKSRVSSGKYANVVLSDDGVFFGAIELLFSGHSPFIPMNNVYSTSTLDRAAIFKKLEARFGETCVFVYVSSPQTFGVPNMGTVRHWPVEAADSLKKLYQAQQSHLL